MSCFGEVEKISIVCEDCFKDYHKRFALYRDKSEIIVTVSSNLVSKYDTKNHLYPIQSWSFEELNKLCVPLSYRYQYGKDRFVGIHSCNTVIEWTLNETNELVQVFNKSLHNQILDIIWPRMLRDPLLIFSNGWITSLDQIKNDQVDLNSVIESNEKIIGIQYAKQSSKKLLIYYIVNDKQNNFFVYRCEYKKGHINLTCKSPIPQKIDFWTIFPSKKCLIAATKDKDFIYLYSLEPPIEKFQPIYKFESNSFDSLCSFSIDSRNDLMCFIRQQKSDGHLILDVYETNYSVKIGSMNLGQTNLKDFSIIEDNIFITCTNNIIMVPIIHQNLLLSQLLTKSLRDIHSDGVSTGYEIKIENLNKIKKQFKINNVDGPVSLEELKKIHKHFESKREALPEEVIVFLLDFCTKNYLKESKSNNDEQILMELKSLFKGLVEVPFNEIFLVSCLKSSNLSIDQYLICIEFLLDLLPFKNPHILTWISVLIDVNCNKFILRPNSQIIDILNMIYERVCFSIEFFHELGTIKTILESMNKRERVFLNAITKPTNVRTQYTIERLTFK